MKHLLHFIIIAGFLGGCETAEQEEKGISCSAEKVKKVDGRELFVQGNHFFGNGNTQSKGVARTGKFSCKVTAEQPYGFDYKIDTLKPGDKIIATVWRKGTGGVLAIKNESGYYKQTKEVAAVEGEWEQLQLEMLIDDYNYDQQYLLHCWLANKEQPAFFDDFEVQIIRQKRKKAFIPKTTPVLHIQLTGQAREHITAKRNEAMKKGLIVSGKDSKVSTSISINGEKYTGTIRLKGDMLDHVRDKKWSFRIELEKGKTWQGMNEFSIQNPLTRSYLHEWYFHELLQKEEILSPKYGFVFVVLNNDTLGLYAYEEHFAPELLTAQNRTVGPILKFDEDKMWEVRQQNNMQDVPGLPIYETAEVKVYSGTREKPHTMTATTNMRAYQYGSDNSVNIIGPRQVGAYLAVLDVCKAYHALIWHNQRWYYNPQNQKLEPIGYDGYTHNGPFDWVDAPYLGYEFYNNQKLNKEEVTRLLYDSTIYSHYMNTLERISAQEYVTQFLKETQKKAAMYEQWIQFEYPDYKYDTQFLHQQASSIKKHLPTEKVDFSKLKKPVVELSEEMTFYPHILFQAKQKGERITVTNFYSQPIIISGASNNPETIEDNFWLPIDGFTKRETPPQNSFSSSKNYKYVFVTTAKQKKNIAVEIK